MLNQIRAGLRTKEFIFDGLRKFPQLTIPLLPFCAHTHRTELVCPRNTLSFSCFSTSHSTTVWSPDAVSIFSSLSIHVMSNIALLCACQSVHQVYKRFGHSILVTGMCQFIQSFFTSSIIKV